MPSRAFLLLVTAVTCSVGPGQPPRPKAGMFDSPPPAYTAFPDLKALDETAFGQHPTLPTEPGDASPLRKVQQAQLKQGLMYIKRVNAALSFAGPDPAAFEEDVKMVVETYRLGAELEDVPAKRIAWHETRIRQLKGFERYTRLRVEAGALKPQRLEAAAYARLQAEADLLKLKAELEKGTGAAPVPAPAIPPNTAAPAPPVASVPTPAPVTIVAAYTRTPAVIGCRLFRRR